MELKVTISDLPQFACLLETLQEFHVEISKIDLNSINPAVRKPIIKLLDGIEKYNATLHK